MNNNDPININKLFDEIIEEEVVIKKQSKLQLKEQQRLQTLYDLDKDNIDDVFEHIISEDNYELEIENPYINTQIGNRLIIKIVGRNKRTEILYEAECLLCNNTSISTIYQFKENNKTCKKCIQLPSIGDKFNKWTILERSNVVGKGVFYVCKCDCGFIQSIKLASLNNKSSTQCRTCGFKNRSIISIDKKYNEYIGKKFGTLTILEFISNYKCRKTYARCICDCGRDVYRVLYNIINKNQTTCFICTFSDTSEDPYIGQKFGKKTIIEVVNRKNITIQCECGKISKSTYKDQLRHVAENPNTACTQCTRKRLFLNSEYSKIYVGQKNGARTIIDTTLIYNKFKQPTVKVKCECGTESMVILRTFLKQKNKKCQSCYSKNDKRRVLKDRGINIKFRSGRIGEVINNWEIIDFSDDKHVRVVYKIQCNSCGIASNSRIDNIKNKKCSSQFCKNKE